MGNGAELNLVEALLPETQKCRRNQYKRVSSDEDYMKWMPTLGGAGQPSGHRWP